MPLLPEEMFLWNTKNTPNKRPHLPQMFSRLLNTPRNPWVSSIPTVQNITWVGVKGWGKVGYTADFYLDSFISGLLRDNAALDIAKTTLSLQVLSL